MTHVIGLSPQVDSKPSHVTQMITPPPPSWGYHQRIKKTPHCPTTSVNRTTAIANMLDIEDFIEERGGNPEKIRESQRRRNESVELVDEVIALWQDARKGESR